MVFTAFGINSFRATVGLKVFKSLYNMILRDIITKAVKNTATRYDDMALDMFEFLAGIDTKLETEQLILYMDCGANMWIDCREAVAEFVARTTNKWDDRLLKMADMAFNVKQVEDQKKAA